jgi:two-component system alkaline phosphatase synthesis response regulator PhoP
MGKHAFVVEDDDNIREIVKYSLESCGLEVTGFDNAVSMLEQLGKSTPDIILLDIMLPTMDGLEALKRIKAGTNTAGIPVILLTAKSSEIDKVTGLDLGADDYITKPFGVLELMARVRAALRHEITEEEKPEVFEYGGLLLDTARHEVYLEGKKIELTLKEFDLLELLMRNAGKVLRRNTLLDDIWGYGYAGETRTLDMHIRSLRQKLEDDAENSRYISTVRGVGYKFNA